MHLWWIPNWWRKRTGLQKGAAWWDLYLSTFVALAGPLINVLIAGLDRRYGWSGEVVFLQQIAAPFIFLAAGLLGTWAMAANRFFCNSEIAKWTRAQCGYGCSIQSNSPPRLPGRNNQHLGNAGVTGILNYSNSCFACCIGLNYPYRPWRFFFAKWVSRLPRL